MAAPHVLIVLDTSSAWTRGVHRGFARVAHEQGWTLLHYHPNVDVRWVASQWPLDAAVLGPSHLGPWPESLRGCVSVSVNADRTAERIASVCLDEPRIGRLALSHLVERGFRNVTTFRLDDSPFGAIRERNFSEAAALAKVRFEPGWWAPGATPPRTEEHPPAIKQWLRQLTKPCGVFACCDAWARVMALYARAVHLRIPEDLALIGVDNDTVECELIAPPLSSVAVPWRAVGEHAAQLVLNGLRGKPVAGKRVVVAPVDVVTRRSTDTLAIEDPLVKAAVAWVHQHAEKRLNVSMITRATGTTRQRLERHFRGALGRTVLQEVRRAHVELARRLLSTTDLALVDVAERSGFSSAPQLSVAFNREVGMPPGVYRRSVKAMFGAEGD